MIQTGSWTGQNMAVLCIPKTVTICATLLFKKQLIFYNKKIE